MCIDGVRRQESTGKGLVVLEVVQITVAIYSGNTMNQDLCAPLFPRPLLIVVLQEISMCCTSSIGDIHRVMHACWQRNMPY